jgi:coenzyme F420-reducing hydrogenase delta subunit
MPDGELQTATGREPSAIGHSPSAIHIVAFCCHYCAYAAADLAGSMRLEYPASIKVIELPCSGKLDALYVLRAFEDGADGVMVAG